MAIYLFKLIRRKLREREAQKAVPTTDDAHLVPEYAPGQDQQQQGLHHDKNAQSGAMPTQKSTPEQIAQDKAETHRRRMRQLKLILGLTLPNFLAAMDVTIVAPAIPLISSHFNRLSGSFNWIVAAYTLTFTTFVPASGQLAQIYGRHFTLQFQMFWILIGSVLCAAAQTWGMLLLGRALQGLGAAGILSLSRIILSDGATLAENSRNNSVLSLVSGLSYAVGPVIGGYLASAGWRYLFVLPIGVATLAMVFIFFVVRKELVKGTIAHNPGESRRLGYISGLAIIDWPGMTMFIFGIGLIILAVQWGGTEHAWSSAACVAPLVIGGVLCVLFFVYEYLLGPGRAVARMFPRQVPMIPSTLFRKKDTTILLIINFSAGISLVSAFYFISIFWQLAEGYSASKSGVQLLYYTPGLGVGVYTAMFFCNRFPRQTYFALCFGSLVECVGLSVLTYAVSIRHTTLVSVFLAVSGAGTGLRFMPVVLHAAGTWSTRIPSMQSLLSFMLPFGQTVGISLMSAVFSNKFDHYLAQINGSGSGSSLPSSGPPNINILQNLPGEIKEDVQNAAAKAVMWALISVLPFVGLSFITSIFLGNVWIGKAAQRAEGKKPAVPEQKGMVMYSSYLIALVTGSISAHKEALDSDKEHEGQREKVNDVEASSVNQPEIAHVAK